MLDKTPLKERCKGRWPDILARFMPMTDKVVRHRNAPCPKCGGSDRFRFIDRESDGFWCCSQCGSGDGVSLVMLICGVDFPAAAKLIEEVVGGCQMRTEKRDDAKEHAAMVALWKRSEAIRKGCTGDLYLIGRGIDLASFPDALRYVPDCPYQSDSGSLRTSPAMIARVVSREGKAVNVWRTFLGPVDGPKRKAMRGGMPPGCHVRLAPSAERMGIAEGIETALSAMILFGIPVWSTLGTDGMEKFEPPAECKELVIYADRDWKYGGERAAFTLAHRLACKDGPVKVSVELPSVRPSDFNDLLRAKHEAGA